MPWQDVNENGGTVGKRYIGNCNSQPPVEGKSAASRNGVGQRPWPAAPRVVLDDIVYIRNKRRQKTTTFKTSGAERMTVGRLEPRWGM
jgi:hypothetical protein